MRLRSKRSRDSSRGTQERAAMPWVVRGEAAGRFCVSVPECRNAQITAPPTIKASEAIKTSSPTAPGSGVVPEARSKVASTRPAGQRIATSQRMRASHRTRAGWNARGHSQSSAPRRDAVRKASSNTPTAASRVRGTSTLRRRPRALLEAAPSRLVIAGTTTQGSHQRSNAAPRRAGRSLVARVHPRSWRRHHHSMLPMTDDRCTVVRKLATEAEERPL